MAEFMGLIIAVHANQEYNYYFGFKRSINSQLSKGSCKWYI